jgi:two-component system sensor histidine kinase MprB
VLRTEEVDGVPLRVATVGLPQGGALRASVDLSGDRAALRDLRRRLSALSLIGALAAAAVGWIAALRLTGPLARLSSAAEHVAATEDLTTPIADPRPDEVGRLSRSLATMLAALAASRAQQQRLVQDAGHELRTPLTSLRTNLEVLEQADRLDPEDRARLLADLRTEVDELTALVGEVVSVAAAGPGPRSDEPRAEHDLADLARGVVERHRRRTGREITLTSEPTPAVVATADVERAISNLVDNALKFSPAGTPVAVDIRAGRVVVSDDGPGIAPAEAELVFQRFYRADAARSTPGSGLGLAIVAQVVAAHGGTCFAGPRTDGRPGAAIGFVLPSIRA